MNKLLRTAALLWAVVLWTATVQGQEMRIATITIYEDINDTASIQSWVNETASMKYNAIAIHTRYRGDATYFPNKYNSTYPNPEPRSFSAGSIDVLEEFVTRGHAAGLKVFAYVNTNLVTDGSNTDSRPSHVINTHPEWITYYRNNGGAAVRQTVSHDGEGIWLDPALPAVRDYTTNICADIMANYNCDGIIIDRIRYPQTNWNRVHDFGYHPDAVAAFNAAHGGSGLPSPSNTTWQGWRREQINLMVEDIYEAITAQDPDHILLAFPIGRLNDAINFNYQDWPEWLDRGIIDGCLPQVYRNTLNEFNTGADEHLNAYSGDRLLGVATKAYSAGINVEAQISSARSKGFDGSSPFRHATLGTYGYTNQVSNAYSTAATWPSMPWKTPSEFIVDNTSSGFSSSSSWWSSSSTPGYYDSNYRVRSTASMSDSAAWKANLPASGSYKVQVRYTSGSNRASAAPYIVYHTGGSTTVGVNQRQNGGQWITLGTFNFSAGNATRVRLSCWTSSGSYVIADAVRLVPQ